MFAGDFAPVSRYTELIKIRGKEIFGDLIDDISSADLSFLNLETPICKNGSPIKKIGPSLHGFPESMQIVKETGFNIIGLANNHIMDYGLDGLKETLQACYANELFAIGAGENLEAAQGCFIIKKKGLKVAFIAIAEHEFNTADVDKPGAAPLDSIDNGKQIEIAKKKADLVFVTVHGGNEYFRFPRPGLRKICKYFIDKGADAVICHHPHVSGSYEIYNGKLIVYSLGNLIFDHPKPPEGWNDGYAVRLEYEAVSKKFNMYEFIPYNQSVKNGGIQKLKNHDKDIFISKLNSYNGNLIDEEKYKNEWNNFCNTEGKSSLLKLFLPFTFRGINKVNKWFNIERFILPKKTILLKNNLLRCESHRELLLNILERKC